MLGSFDMQFKQDATDQPYPLDITKVPEFASVVSRHKMNIQYAELERRKELKSQVDGATYNKLCVDLKDDMASVTGPNNTNFAVDG